MTRPVVELTADGRTVRAPAGTTVAAALLDAGVMSFHESVDGEARTPLCGMGVCLECRVTIDGIPHRRACMVVVREGMIVSTAGLRA